MILFPRDSAGGWAFFERRMASLWCCFRIDKHRKQNVKQEVVLGATFFCCSTLLRQSIDLKEMGFTTWRGSTRYRRWFKRRANVLPARASGLQWWNVCQELTDTGVGWMFAVHLSGGSICWMLKCDCFNLKAES